MHGISVDEGTMEVSYHPIHGISVEDSLGNPSDDGTKEVSDHPMHGISVEDSFEDPSKEGTTDVYDHPMHGISGEDSLGDPSDEGTTEVSDHPIKITAIKMAKINKIRNDDDKKNKVSRSNISKLSTSAKATKDDNKNN